MGLVLLICVLAVPCHLLELLWLQWVFFRVRHRHPNRHMALLFDGRSVSDLVAVAGVLAVLDFPLTVYLSSGWA